MTLVQVMRAFFYVFAIAFHYFVFASDLGNYFHGGTPMALLCLEVMAVSILVLAIKLFQKAGRKERALIALLAAVPTVAVVWSLTTALSRAI